MRIITLEKNDKIVINKEKVEYQESILKEGEKKFLKKQRELKFLEILYKDLKNELDINKNKIKNIFKYKS